MFHVSAGGVTVLGKTPPDDVPAAEALIAKLTYALVAPSLAQGLEQFVVNPR